MEVILLKDIKKLGIKGQVVRVRDGYARNFLMPRNEALPCTQASRKFVEDQQARAEKRRAKEAAEAEKTAKNLENLKLTIEAACGEQDKLFGSVTAEDISQLLDKQGHSVEKKKIQIKEPIRTLGSHEVSVEIYPQVKAQVQIEVLRKAE